MGRSKREKTTLTDTAVINAQVLSAAQERASSPADAQAGTAPSQERITDLQAITRLYEVGNRCVRASNDFHHCLETILEAAIFLTGAEKGNIQLLDAASGALVIVEQRGFEPPFLTFFARVDEVSSACGAAMQSAAQVVVEDVTHSEIFAEQPSLDVMLAAGVRAVQSTPLVSSAGNVLGMISTHFSRPTRLDERELRLMDLLARQAADYLERKRQEQEIADLNTRLQRAVAETHHRVKNHLQTLYSLVEMQLPDTEETISVETLRRVGQHIQAFATLYDLLTSETKAVAEQDIVSLKVVLEKLVPLLNITTGTRTINLHTDEMFVPLKQSGSLVLLVNELVSNALKHGKGAIEVTLSLLPATAEASERRMVCLEVCDEGPGFPSDFDPKSAANTGLELIESLARWDLRGQIESKNREEGGARVSVSFPLPEVT